MKNLIEYLREAQLSESVDATQTSKDITFNFTGIDNGEDAVKKIQELIGESGVTVSIDGQKVTVSFSKDTFEQLSEIISVLKDFIKVEGKSSKRASSEQYAQKLHAFEDAIKEMDAFKNECETIEEPESVMKSDDQIKSDKTDDKK